MSNLPKKCLLSKACTGAESRREKAVGTKCASNDLANELSIRNVISTDRIVSIIQVYCLIDTVKSRSVFLTA